MRAPAACVAIVLAVLWCLSVLTPLAGAEKAPARPQLDVAVETSVHVVPTSEAPTLPAAGKHTKAYLAEMLKLARQCLMGLVAEPAPAPGQPLADGAAPYRLFIRHKGTVEVASSAVADEGQGGVYDGIRHLKATQKGTFLFRLAKWSGTDYPTLDQWTSKFGSSHYVAVGPTVTADEMPEFREAVLMLAMPDALKRGLLDHLLPMKLEEVTGTAGATKTLGLSVCNKSLWPLKTLGVTVTWVEKAGERQYRYQAKLRYAGLLRPTGRAVLRGLGVVAPSEFAWEYSLPTKIEAVPTFAPQAVASSPPASGAAERWPARTEPRTWPAVKDGGAAERKESLT